MYKMQINMNENNKKSMVAQMQRMNLELFVVGDGFILPRP